jgi:hypothetical protein
VFFLPPAVKEDSAKKNLMSVMTSGGTASFLLARSYVGTEQYLFQVCKRTWNVLYKRASKYCLPATDRTKKASFDRSSFFTLFFKFLTVFFRLRSAFLVFAPVTMPLSAKAARISVFSLSKRSTSAANFLGDFGIVM